MRKFYVILLAFSFFSLSAAAQFVEIWDPQFKAKLMTLYPGCFNAQQQLDTTCTAITTAVSLSIEGTGDGYQMMSINGVEYFDNLRTLDCSGNSLSEINRLPPLLEWLDCSNQVYAGFINWYQFGTLPQLPSTLVHLDIHSNGFSTLPALPSGLTWLDCSLNQYHSSQGINIPQMLDLGALPPALTYLNCSRNRLTSLPALPSGLQYLDARNNKFYYAGTFIYDFPGIACLPQIPGSLQTLLMYGNNLFCLPNTVAGMTTDILLPVCAPGNDVNNCMNFTSPLITANPDTIFGLVVLPAAPSASASYNLSAVYLNPAAGNITITPSVFLELSVDNINFSASSLTIPYAGAQLASTPIYVRISAVAPQTAFTGTVTHSGGGAPAEIVDVTGDVLRPYYNTKANLGLAWPGSWSSTVDGTGNSPISFTDANQVFHIVNPSNVTYAGVWSVSGLNSKVILGDGVTPIVFTVPEPQTNAFYGEIDVTNNAILRCAKSNSLPTFGFMADGSTVEFTSVTPNATYVPVNSYFNLKLMGSGKVFRSGTTTIRGQLMADGVLNLKGESQAAQNPSIVNCFRNVSFINGTSFAPDLGGYFVLKMNGPGPDQNIINDASVPVIPLFALEADSNAVNNIILPPGLNLQLGSQNGGGLYFRSSNTTLTTSGGEIKFVWLAKGPYLNGLSQINSSGTSFSFLSNNNATYTYPSALPQGVRRMTFTVNSTIKSLLMNVNALNASADNLTLSNNVEITDSLILLSGRIIVEPGMQLKLASSCGLRGGNSKSFVDGKLRRSGNTDFLYPMGNGFQKYRPVIFANQTGNSDYTVEYKAQGYPNNSIDPTTLGLYPNYAISGQEHWNINPALPGGTATLTFHYKDASSLSNLSGPLRVAHFDGIDWDDLGGTAGATNNQDSGSVQVANVSDFSPFTFSASIAVVPVKLTGFRVQKRNMAANLTWTTEQEINSKEFVIERSIDQNRWNQLLRVNAAGSSSEKQIYSAIDFTPHNGINFYRLRITDLDDRSVYSEIKSALFGSTANVLLAPNPATKNFTVYLPSLTVPATIRIFSQSGQLMKNIQATGESTQVTTSSFAPGVYLVMVTGKNVNEVKKLVIE